MNFLVGDVAEYSLLPRTLELRFVRILCINYIRLYNYLASFSLLARIGFAFSMGSCVPLCVSLLSDLTMPNERGIA